MCKVWSAVNSSDRQEYFCVVRALEDVIPDPFELFGAVLLSLALQGLVQILLLNV